MSNRNSSDVMTLLAFTVLAQRMPYQVLEVINKSRMGESAVTWGFSQKLPDATESDKQCFYQACQWIDEMFLPKIVIKNV